MKKNKDLGGKKNDQGKLARFDLIPADITWEIAELYGIGAKKYEDNNWRKGMNWGRLIRALESHLTKFKCGQMYDVEDGQRHIISVAWCAIALAWYEMHGIGNDDRWKLDTFELFDERKT